MENETENQVPVPTDGTPPPTQDETPLAIRDEFVPAKQYAAEKITDVLPPAAYERIGQFSLTEEQEAILNEPLPVDEVDIRPDDGAVYASHEYYRRKLNKTFGRMGWTLVPGSPLTQRPQTNEWYQRWVLFVGGVYVAEAIASRDYQPTNARMDLSDVAEAIKSDALRRCCKDLGIATECWNKRWTEKWKHEHAVQVVAQVWKKGQQVNAKVWRRKDADPLPGEQTSSARGTASPQTSPAPQAATAAPAPPKSTETAPKAPEAPKQAQPAKEAPKPPAAAAPAQPAKAPAAPKLLDSQVRMAFAQARQAGLVVGENADPLMEILETEFKVARVVSDGKKSTELCHAMLKSLPGNLFTGLLKRMKEQTAQPAATEQPENI
jgi:hypothetical protein